MKLYCFLKNKIDQNKDHPVSSIGKTGWREFIPIRNKSMVWTMQTLIKRNLPMKRKYTGLERYDTEKERIPDT